MTDTHDPYDVGDRVRVSLAADDAESPFDGAVCRVVHVFTDDAERDLDASDDPDRSREMDRASYRLEDESTGDVLPVVVRHRDLAPVDEDA